MVVSGYQEVHLLGSSNQLCSFDLSVSVQVNKHLSYFLLNTTFINTFFVVVCIQSFLLAPASSLGLKTATMFLNLTWSVYT